MVAPLKAEKTKILVIGSGGMLGKDLYQELAGNYRVAGADIRLSSSGDEFIELDITDEEAAVRRLTGARPDVIVHLAAWTDVDGCENDHAKATAINVSGTAHVARAAVALNVPLIYVSTDFVFDGRKKTLYREDDRPHPINFYGMTKLAGEQEVLKTRNFVILRTSWLYGTNGKNFVDTVIGKAQEKKRLEIVDDQAGSPTYTKDAAKAIHAIIAHLPATGGKIYHVSNKGVVSWYEYCRQIMRYAGMDDVEVVPISSDTLNRPARRPAFSGLDVGRLEKEADITMRPWTEALKEYIHERKTVR
ncbi:MAG: dTDP-4-dehydrorhamnose reductase [Candidatus Omnitrophica bacterium]|nr:dTDP-4-dehydrorhamnose reductase [Candidatus Omnitrophota bacterium]